MKKEETKKRKISTHTPHARRDNNLLLVCGRSYAFQLTRLMRGVTVSVWKFFRLEYISTHTPHARRDTVFVKTVLISFDFNSHASCEAWLLEPTPYNFKLKISTHTPHARRDFQHYFNDYIGNNFNSHASCEAWHPSQMYNKYFPNFNSHASCEAWHNYINLLDNELLFQLTRLMRGVTLSKTSEFTPIFNFNSHASCEAWQWYKLNTQKI